MKVLLDEHLPHALRRELSGHDYFTAAYMGWSGVENGDLLAIAAAAAFDVVVTNDHGLEYEQNLDTLPVAVVLLMAEANTIEAIRPLYPSLLEALTTLQPRQLVKLDRLS